MKHADLSRQWKKIIHEFLISKGIRDRKKLDTKDFDPKSIVKIRFDDESSAEFNQAFFIYSKELNEIAVFTEHCGYYIFSKDLAHVINFKKISQV